MGKVTKVHEQALTASTTEALMAVYDDWAANYDHDLMDNWGYSTPARVADFLKRYLTVDDALILDAGCGTGLVGTALVANGLSRLEGLGLHKFLLDWTEQNQSKKQGATSQSGASKFQESQWQKAQQGPSGFVQIERPRSL